MANKTMPILYIGGGSHRPNKTATADTLNAVSKLAEADGHTISWHTMSPTPVGVENETRHAFTNCKSVDEMVRQMKKTGCKYAITVWNNERDGYFNKAKSNIKFILNTLAGIVGFYPDWGEYKYLPSHVLFDTPEQLWENIKAQLDPARHRDTLSRMTNKLREMQDQWELPPFFNGYDQIYYIISITGAGCMWRVGELAKRMSIKVLTFDTLKENAPCSPRSLICLNRHSRMERSPLRLDPHRGPDYCMDFDDLLFEESSIVPKEMADKWISWIRKNDAEISYYTVSTPFLKERLAKLVDYDKIFVLQNMYLSGVAELEVPDASHVHRFNIWNKRRANRL